MSMTSERWQQIKVVLYDALETPPEQRSAFLARVCSDDRGMRQEVESFLAMGDEQARSSFLQSSEIHVSLSPGTKLGEYEVQSLLGVGGMGEVYRARDPRLMRDVAIKVLPSLVSDDLDWLRRFEQEAQAAAALNHPRICTVHDVGDYGGQPFFVMELLEGRSLNERIADKAIPTPELVDLAVQTCDALQAAHDKGIIHRDIKPANIFLSTSGQIKILDFGLAKLVEERHSATIDGGTPEAEIVASRILATRCGRLMGTPAYLSPEQARGEEVDARTDIFSFGLVLYEMATGHPAFRGQTSGELINAILHKTPVKPSTLNPAVPGSLERIILKALDKTRTARYQSASELLNDLNEFQKATQRRTVWRIRVAVTAITLVLSTAVVVWAILSKSTVTEAPDIIQRQVTSNPVNDSVYVAAISADGKQVAYTDLHGVHVRALDSGQVSDVPILPGLCFR